MTEQTNEHFNDAIIKEKLDNTDKDIPKYPWSKAIIFWLIVTIARHYSDSIEILILKRLFQNGIEPSMDLYVYHGGRIAKLYIFFLFHVIYYANDKYFKYKSDKYYKKKNKVRSFTRKLLEYLFCPLLGYIFILAIEYIIDKI